MVVQTEKSGIPTQERTRRVILAVEVGKGGPQLRREGNVIGDDLTVHRAMRVVLQPRADLQETHPEVYQHEMLAIKQAHRLLALPENTVVVNGRRLPVQDLRSTRLTDYLQVLTQDPSRHIVRVRIEGELATPVAAAPAPAGPFPVTVAPPPQAAPAYAVPVEIAPEPEEAPPLPVVETVEAPSEEPAEEVEEVQASEPAVAAPVEEAEAVEELAAPEVHAKRYASKYEALRDQMAEDIEALDLDGLFVRNLLDQNIINRRIIRFLPRKTLNELMMQANSQVRDQQYDKAEETFSALSEAEPDNADYAYLYGRLLMLKGDHEAGLQVLRKLQDREHEMASKFLSRVEAHYESAGAYPTGAELLRITGGAA